MCWLKRDLWKAGIAFAGMLLLLVAIAGLPVLAADTHEEIAGLAGPGTVSVQVTPTEDATVTALNKEKLAQEVQQLKNQNEQLKNQNEPNFFVWLLSFVWLRTNASILLVVGGGLIGLWRWIVARRDAQDKELKDHQNEREKRAEERFQKAVEGLASDNEGVKVGAAILLRTFLQPDYEQFYNQVFDLAVVHLRLRKADPTPSEPVDSLSQALISVFRESFPLARDRLEKQRFQSSPQILDATGVQLDNAYLSGADLRGIWMPAAHLQHAHLFETDLRDARLKFSILKDAYLKKAKLQQVQLWRADLTGANLTEADLTEVHLTEADLTEADLTKTNLENAHSLKDADLRRVTGLTKEQKDACKAKGAIIDKAPTTSPSRSPVSPPPPSQSNELQAPSVPPAQRSTPTSNADGSSATSSKPSLEP